MRNNQYHLEDDDLQSKVCRSISPSQTVDDLDVETLEEHLLSPHLLVRFNGPNKEAIRERMRMPILCECGCTITRDTIWRHRKTMKRKIMLEETLRKKGSVNQ